jgi:hypothetical protein
MRATMTARAPLRAAPALACRSSVANAAPLAAAKATQPRARRAALARRGTVCYTVRARAHLAPQTCARCFGKRAGAHAPLARSPDSHRIAPPSSPARSLTAAAAARAFFSPAQEWLLDAPGCAPYREVEEVAEAGVAAAGTTPRVDRHVTRKPLHTSGECAAGVVHGIPADLTRLEKAVPLNLSEVRRAMRRTHTYAHRFVHLSPRALTPPAAGAADARGAREARHCGRRGFLQGGVRGGGRRGGCGRLHHSAH